MKVYIGYDADVGMNYIAQREEALVRSSFDAELHPLPGWPEPVEVPVEVVDAWIAFYTARNAALAALDPYVPDEPFDGVPCLCGEYGEHECALDAPENGDKKGDRG